MRARDADRAIRGLHCKVGRHRFAIPWGYTSDAKSTFNRRRNSLKQMRRISGDLSLRRRRRVDSQDTCAPKSPRIHLVYARGSRSKPHCYMMDETGCDRTRKHISAVVFRKPDHCNLEGRRNLMGHVLSRRFKRTSPRRLINAIITMRGTCNFYSMEIFILKTNNNASLMCSTWLHMKNWRY